MKEVTNFGRVLRDIRSKRNITQTEMARMISAGRSEGTISSAFLSYVESGVKMPPKTWETLIPDVFDLTKAETKEFLDAYKETVDINFKIEKIIMSNKSRKQVLDLLLNTKIEDEVFEKVYSMIVRREI